MIQSYSTATFPPIPVLDIALSAPATDDWCAPLSAIVDSGADFTIAPVALLEEIAAPITRPAVLSNPWQDRRQVYVYEVDLRIGLQVLPAVEVAGDPFSDELLLGRNVLNLLDLRLEGPALRIHVR